MLMLLMLLRRQAPRASFFESTAGLDTSGLSSSVFVTRFCRGACVK
jgi:hypothetical protein